VATARGHLGSITGETDLGRARGKVWYMAPEELWGEPVDRRADLFALGVVLYRMTTGRHPFGNEGGRKSVRRLLAGAQAIPPTTFVPNYPEALQELVLQVLAERPDERPGTALELRRSLFKAVTPASDDDVAQFLAELFSGRRLERDERLRVALDSRPGSLDAKPPTSAEKHPGERSNQREVPRPRFGRSQANAVALGVAGLALGVFGSCALLRHGGANATSPAPDGKIATAVLEPVTASRVTPAAVPQSPPTLAAREPLEPEPSADKAPRHEKRSFDVSPVREVGF
jgi:serine/threonine-protein kinase